MLFWYNLIGTALAILIFKLFRIKDKTAQGLACGTAAHGLGTTKAIELGEVQGAMSGSAIIITGIITAVVAPLLTIYSFR